MGEFGLQESLDLKENPFNPKLPGGKQIAGEAMPVHQFPQLIDELLCINVAGVQEAIEKLKRVLFDQAPEGGDPVQNSILLIHGVRGSGRSTLANLIRSWLVQPDALAAERWQQCGLTFDANIPPPHPDEIKQKFKDLRESLGKFAQDDAKRVVVLIDNLPCDCFGYVVSAFKSAESLNRVVVVTTDDAKLIDSDLDAYEPVIQPVMLSKLCAAEVRLFINERLRRYRNGRAQISTSDPEFALFPFTVTAPESAVVAGNKPVRNVLQWLRRQIEDGHSRVLKEESPADVATLPSAGLRARMIP